MKFIQRALIFLLLTGSHSSMAQKTLICLTYDDGLPSQLSTAIPQLDSFGLRGTFFLNGIQGASTRIGEASPMLVGWKSAAGKGHELGNHTLFHACPARLGWPEALAIESYTEEQLMREIRVQQELLALIDPSRKKRAFAYPCNNTVVGKKDYSLVIQRSGLVSFCRGGGDSTSIVSDLKKITPQWVPSWLVHEGATLEQLISFAQKARASGGMAVYQFHGIGGEFFQVSADTHRAFLSYLKEHSPEFRVITFSEAIAGAVKGER